MRKITLFMLCLLAGLSLTACLGDDDNSNAPKVLTDAEKAAQLSAISGDYEGQVFFSNDTIMRTDSLEVSWRITAMDSMLTIRNFPVRILANGIVNTEARSILNTDSREMLHAYIIPYANNYGTEGHYTFLIIPKEGTFSFTVEKDEVEHQVKVVFAQSMTAQSSLQGYGLFYSVGEYLSKEMMAFFLIKDVVIDNVTYTPGLACYIRGEKYY